MTRRTVARTAELTGVGLHTGCACRMRLAPAAAGAGVVFMHDSQPIPARLERVFATDRRTALHAGSRGVETVEHLLAASYAIGIDDLTVTVDGPELPILDGSFAPFLALIDEAGTAVQPGALRVAVLAHPLEVVEGQARYRIEPAEDYEVAVSLEYREPVIGRQGYRCTVTERSFRTEIAGARTFGFLAEVSALRSRGLLGGATPECAILLSDEAVLNTTLRWPDEFARHKLGDLIGDLALLGVRLSMRVRASRPSHSGNIACARAIAAAARYLEA